MPYHKRPDMPLPEAQKSIALVTTTVLRITDELLYYLQENVLDCQLPCSGSRDKTSIFLTYFL